MSDEDRIIDRFLASERRQLQLLGAAEYEKQRGPKYRATLRALYERSGLRAGAEALRENQRVVNDSGEIFLERLPIKPGG